MGHFMTSKDILKLNPIVTSDVFRMMPGVRLEAGVVSMRGGGFENCSPNIYINGTFMSGLTASDVDDFIRPTDIIGIEIYASAVPPQFQPALSGCGSIVFWARN